MSTPKLTAERVGSYEGRLEKSTLCELDFGANGPDEDARLARRRVGPSLSFPERYR
ncbi:hypothetical protein ACFQJ7_16335 [Halovenus rubra]|uniref:Uncharacterized protein n=1 Tax=Halovenus rubra TaxID=869890 RepID=A0ABD5X8R0_9EURY|nr:hypothetical protein [Halovenus rubra]